MVIICEWRDVNLEGSSILSPFSKIIVVSLPLGPIHSLGDFLARFTEPGRFPPVKQVLLNSIRKWLVAPMTFMPLCWHILSSKSLL